MGAFAVALLTLLTLAIPIRGQAIVEPPATSRAECGAGSHPERGRQGRVSAEDISSGWTANGLRCNTSLIGRYGETGGYKVERYIDAAGHECGYYDSTLLFPANAASKDGTGVLVMDLTDPRNPVKTDNLVSPAMQSPHESLVMSRERGLLAAVLGNPFFYPGQVDIYDISTDCRHPVLLSSTPMGIIGHESGFAPDGMTLYAASLDTGNLTAVDVSDPRMPITLWTGYHYTHGLSISEDGTRAYLAANHGVGHDDSAGLVILDVSQIQFRVPNPLVRVVSELTWDTASIPQNAIPVTIGGRPYVIEVDEFAGEVTPVVTYHLEDVVGAARIIDIGDERHPFVASDIRLEVHSAKNRPGQEGDPQATNGLQGYAGHYCNVPTRVDPGLLACSFILSGLRLFDIRDPRHPREVGYYNVPLGSNDDGSPQTAYAMSSPAFAPERREVWYSDGNHGLFGIKVAASAWTASSTPYDRGPSQPAAALPSPPIAPARAQLTRTVSPTGRRTYMCPLVR